MKYSIEFSQAKGMWLVLEQGDVIAECYNMQKAEFIRDVLNADVIGH